MKPLGTIYKDQFFRSRWRLHWRAPIFCQAIIDMFDPKSVVDVGCGTGDLVRQFRQMGIKSDGVEGSPHAVRHAVIPDLYHLDLREDQTTEMEELEIFQYRNKEDKEKFINIVRLDKAKYDLVCCMEVAEHIEPEYTKIFLKNITHWSDKLLMSIAGPGQKGRYHVNLQEISYWDDLMKEFGYIQFQSVAETLKNKIKKWKNRCGILAFWQNLVYYEREK